MTQVEVSRTIVFTAPRHARGFFGALVTDNLDIGRPDTLEIIFDRRSGPAPKASSGPPGRSGRAGPWGLADDPRAATAQHEHVGAFGAVQQDVDGQPLGGFEQAVRRQVRAERCMYGLPQWCFGRAGEVIGVAVAWYRVRRRLRTVPVPHVDHMEPHAAESGLNGRPAQGRCRCRGAVDPDQYLPCGSPCHHHLPGLLDDPVPGHAVRPCQPARVPRSTWRSFRSAEPNHRPPHPSIQGPKVLSTQAVGHAARLPIHDPGDAQARSDQGCRQPECGWNGTRRPAAPGLWSLSIRTGQMPYRAAELRSVAARQDRGPLLAGG